MVSSLKRVYYCVTPEQTVKFPQLKSDPRGCDPRYIRRKLTEGQFAVVGPSRDFTCGHVFSVFSPRVPRVSLPAQCVPRIGIGLWIDAVRGRCDMSWIWEKSPTWRWIVRGTRGNPLAMGAFTFTTMFAIPIGLGSLVMSGTNPEVDDTKMAKLRHDAGLDTKIMVRETPLASSPRVLTPRARPRRPTLTRRFRPSPPREIFSATRSKT